MRVANYSCEVSFDTRSKRELIAIPKPTLLLTTSNKKAFSKENHDVVSSTKMITHKETYYRSNCYIPQPISCTIYKIIKIAVRRKDFINPITFTILLLQFNKKAFSVFLLSLLH